MSPAAPEKIRTLQRQLYLKAKAAPAFRFHQLYDKIWRADILRHAWAEAKANKGAAGVDGVSFEQIEAAGLEEWLERLREDLRMKACRPQPVRRVMIPKPGGGERPLGIPTVRDRVAQTAAKLVLEPIFEADLEPSACGCRPRRSAGQAIRLVHELLKQGDTDVVDADLTRYFDTIPRRDLMQSLAGRISDGHAPRPIKQWLKAPVEERDDDGTRRMTGGKASTQGTPQGGVISPLVANLLTSRFLKHWRRRGRDEAFQARVVNYADDFVILSRGHAAAAPAWTQAVMTRLKRALNPTKTAIRDARRERFDFLGYSFGPHCFRQHGRWLLGASPSKKSVQRLQGKVSAIPVPGNLGARPQVRDRLNRLLRGWCACFGHGSPYAPDRVIEGHVYDRVRNFLARRHKVPSRGTRRFPMEAVYGTPGVLRPRQCRTGAPP